MLKRTLVLNSLALVLMAGTLPTVAQDLPSEVIAYVEVVHEVSGAF